LNTDHLVLKDIGPLLGDKDRIGASYQDRGDHQGDHEFNECNAQIFLYASQTTPHHFLTIGFL
jgi:hypothetical protein